MFRDLPPMSAAAFRDDQDHSVDPEASFDAYERTPAPGDGR
jgi:hypothetical protein